MNVLQCNVQLHHAIMWKTSSDCWTSLAVITLWRRSLKHMSLWNFPLWQQPLLNDKHFIFLVTEQQEKNVICKKHELTRKKNRYEKKRKCHICEITRLSLLETNLCQGQSPGFCVLHSQLLDPWRLPHAIVSKLLWVYICDLTNISV